ncbi:Na-translocating system protein MpsC family protein [Marinococcus halophilus]|uniref:Na-translocating system protein MpsC family protein n=1 Tax=Marinococcus halophilus TaxID=1371 RepID=UPI0009A782CA|nr:Na-translocating system protein MpsC family protein [Marinococcus halophilus]
MEQQQTEAQMIAAYIGKALRDHFGKGPVNIHVSYKRPFLVMYVKDFLGPMENILLQQNEEQRVAQSREFIMDEFCPRVQPDIEDMVNGSIKEWYFDWNFEAHTGMIWAVMEEEPSKNFRWPGHLSQRAFERKIINLSIKGQKEPDYTKSYWIDERSVMIYRAGIFVEIEKELIHAGFEEQLKTAKRPMERRLFQEEHMEPILQRKITDVFTDWNFQEDKGYMVLSLEPEKKR